MTTTNRPKPTDRELAKGAFMGSIMLAVLASAFGTCGAFQAYRETAAPRDVAAADLSDANKVPKILA